MLFEQQRQPSAFPTKGRGTGRDRGGASIWDPPLLTDRESPPPPPASEAGHEFATLRQHNPGLHESKVTVMTFIEHESCRSSAVIDGRSTCPHPTGEALRRCRYWTLTCADRSNCRVSRTEVARVVIRPHPNTVPAIDRFAARMSPDVKLHVSFPVAILVPL